MQTVQKTTSISATQSITLVKNLFRASFSSIAYVRNLFSDEVSCSAHTSEHHFKLTFHVRINDATGFIYLILRILKHFTPGKIGDTKYQKIVQRDDQEVKQFVDWLEHGVFDALQKKYLEVVILEIYEGPETRNSKNAFKDISESKLTSRKLLECFSFSISYSGDGANFALAAGNARGDTSRSMEPKAQIKQNTSDVIRLLIELSSALRPLPPSRVISVKLMYTPSTPKEYEPPLFRKAEEDDVAWFSEKPTKISTGSVTTPFHHISMSIRSAQKRANQDDIRKQAEKLHDKNPTMLSPKEIQDKSIRQHKPKNSSIPAHQRGGRRRNTLGKQANNSKYMEASVKVATKTKAKSISAITKSTRSPSKSKTHRKKQSNQECESSEYKPSKSVFGQSEPSSNKAVGMRKSQRIKTDMKKEAYSKVSKAQDSSSTIPPPETTEKSMWTLPNRDRKVSEVNDPVVQIND